MCDVKEINDISRNVLCVLSFYTANIIWGPEIELGHVIPFTVCSTIQTCVKKDYNNRICSYIDVLGRICTVLLSEKLLHFLCYLSQNSMNQVPKDLHPLRNFCFGLVVYRKIIFLLNMCLLKENNDKTNDLIALFKGI